MTDILQLSLKKVKISRIWNEMTKQINYLKIEQLLGIILKFHFRILNKYFITPETIRKP